MAPGVPQPQPAKKRARIEPAAVGGTYFEIRRDAAVQAARIELPVCMHEQEIVETIRGNDVIVITGATGSGKTTQVPQFLLENGFGATEGSNFPGCVAVTQPRRVAALACARRVAYETGSKVGNIVGFHVRHCAEFGNSTRVKFVTDGILLREIQDDLTLAKYSAVVVDEAHERSINTDLLLALLSRTVRLRRGDEKGKPKPFKLIVMSATLDVDGVFAGPSALFPNAPVVSIPARQHPVTIHFARETKADYVAAAFRKVCQIHRKLPAGGILVFVTGRDEVEDLVERVTDALGSGVVVLPFFALLNDAAQQKVFHDYSEAKRKIMIATNIAETSVTIPGVAYVVDTGRVKERVYRTTTGGYVTSFDITWTSQASAEQRAGRAGRTGPGHCYRLYSSAVFDNDFDKFRQAEMLRTPADSVVLRLRSMGIRHICQFPFPSAPDADALQAAEQLLERLGALVPENKDGLIDGQMEDQSWHVRALGVTDVGMALARLPIAPRFGRMLLTARAVSGCLPYAARVAAILSVGGVLEHGRGPHKGQAGIFRHESSDALTQLRALCAIEFTGDSAAQAARDAGHGRAAAESARRSGMASACKDYGVNLKSCVEAVKIARQLECTVSRVLSCSEGGGDDTEGGKWSRAAENGEEVEDGEDGGSGSDDTDTSVLAPMSGEQEVGVVRSILSGFPDQVARRMTIEEAGVYGVAPRLRKLGFTVCSREGAVFLDSRSSVRLERDVEYVCYAELAEVGRRGGGGGSGENGESGRDGEHDDYDLQECGEAGDSDDVGEGGAESKADAIDGADNEGVRRSREVAALASGRTATERAADGGAAGEGRIVLRCASVVRPAWLALDAAPLCRAVVAMPVRSTYDTARDRVEVAVTCHYGVRRWDAGGRLVSVREAERLLVDERDVDDVAGVSNGAHVARVRESAAQAFAEALAGGKVKGVGDDCAGGRRVEGGARLAAVERLTRCLARARGAGSDGGWSRRAVTARWAADGGGAFLRDEFGACVARAGRAAAVARWEAAAAAAAARRRGGRSLAAADEASPRG